MTVCCLHNALKLCCPTDKCFLKVCGKLFFTARKRSRLLFTAVGKQLRSVRWQDGAAGCGPDHEPASDFTLTVTAMASGETPLIVVAGAVGPPFKSPIYLSWTVYHHHYW